MEPNRLNPHKDNELERFKASSSADVNFNSGTDSKKARQVQTSAGPEAFITMLQAMGIGERDPLRASVSDRGVWELVNLPQPIEPHDDFYKSVGPERQPRPFGMTVEQARVVPNQADEARFLILPRFNEANDLIDLETDTYGPPGNIEHPTPRGDRECLIQ